MSIKWISANLTLDKNAVSEIEKDIEKNNQLKGNLRTKIRSIDGSKQSASSRQMS